MHNSSAQINMCDNKPMHVHPIKTPTVYADDDLFALLSAAFTKTPPSENTVVAVTSKIVSLCEGRVLPNHDDREEKEALVRREAELYTDPQSSKYRLLLTVKNQILAINAGIDESNADHQYVLFPKDPYHSAAKIWQWLRTTYRLQSVGVIITDSRTFPLKWGQIGTCLAFCGFSALNNKIGEKDIFGRELHMTQVNVAEALSVAAVLEMGEAAETQPLALISEVNMVQFQDHAPSPAELAQYAIAIEDDAYAPILEKANWKHGGGGVDAG